MSWNNRVVWSEGMFLRPQHFQQQDRYIETLVEVVESADHPWFVACQFHPEFTSTPRDGHPLFSGFVNAALAHQAKKA